MKINDKIKSIIFNNYKDLEIKKHTLLYLFLEITRKCNLNCLHCGSDCTKETNTSELTTESWIKIIDYVCEKFSPQIAFIITGGEPTIHHDLIKIGKYIQQKNRRWGMVTNGMTLTKTMIEELESAGLYSITISFDGTESSHNYLRNNTQSFEKVSKALKIIGNTKLKFKDAVTCVYPQNLNELNEIADILIKNKINSWRLFRIFPSGRAFKNEKLLLSFEQTQQMLNWLKLNKNDYKKRGLEINLSCEGWLPFNEDKKVRDNPFFCRAGVNIASILSDGIITGCSNNHKSFAIGNILENDLSYIWENYGAKFREREWLKDTECNDCKWFNDCKGGSIHLWELGSNKPKFCYLKKIE